MSTGWKLPAKLRKLSEAGREAVTDKFHIIVEGSHPIAPVTCLRTSSCQISFSAP